MLLVFKQIRIVIILITIVLFSGCKKDSEVTRPYTHGKISANLYPFLFNNGSYWVYRDTISSNIDSTTLTHITKSTFEVGPSGPGQGSSGDEEYFQISYLSFPTNFQYSEELLGEVISRGNTDGGYTLLSNKHKGDKKKEATYNDFYLLGNFISIIAAIFYVFLYKKLIY